MIRGADLGYMTVDRWHALWRGIGARVLMNGKDITNTCRWFSGNAAECYVKDDDGRYLIDGDGAKTETLFGCLEVHVP